MTITLVLGGARSGKSRHAEQGMAAFLPAVYIATARPVDSEGDSEMAARIAAHRARRGAGWRVVEEPLALGQAIRDHAGQPLLVDCLTLWLSNLMLAARDREVATTDLLAALAARRQAGGPEDPHPVWIVSNEVGGGIVPENALARQFRDAAGLLNQRVAAAADRVILVVAGLPLTLKER